MSGWLQGVAACSAWPLVGPFGTAGLWRHAWGRPVRAAKQATRAEGVGECRVAARGAGCLPGSRRLHREQGSGSGRGF